MGKRIMARKKIIEEIIEQGTEPTQEFYVLGMGETLKEVSKKFKVSEEKLRELNGEVFGTNQIRLK